MPALMDETLARINLPAEARELLGRAPSVLVAHDVKTLLALAVRDAGADGFHEVSYDVPGRGRVVEARVCRVRNGISANYLEPYMRRRRQAHQQAALR